MPAHEMYDMDDPAEQGTETDRRDVAAEQREPNEPPPSTAVRARRENEDWGNFVDRSGQSDR